jgi:DNA-binding CsgD family transcriptional regulator
MQQGLTQLLDRLGRATDADSVWDVTLDHFTRRGAEWLYYGYAAPLWSQDRSKFFSYSNIPQWWDTHREAQGYRHHDPAVQHCVHSSAPMSFGLGLNEAQYDPVALRMYAEAGEWGARCGGVFPLRSLRGSPMGGLVCLTGMDAGEFGRWWSDMSGTLHLAALAIDARLLHLLQPPPEPVVDLSPRERECLLWLAAGLRTGRIAHRLNISTTAVDLHFANARRKLGARTRDQALLKAVMLGKLVP